MKNFFEVDSFPDFIMGQDMFLQMHHAEDDNHIAEVVNMVNRNQKDFSPYLDFFNLSYSFCNSQIIFNNCDFDCFSKYLKS